MIDCLLLPPSFFFFFFLSLFFPFAPAEQKRQESGGSLDLPPPPAPACPMPLFASPFRSLGRSRPSLIPCERSGSLERRGGSRSGALGRKMGGEERALVSSKGRKKERTRPLLCSLLRLLLVPRPLSLSRSIHRRTEEARIGIGVSSSSFCTSSPREETAKSETENP